jgi:ethanolamine permease
MSDSTKASGATYKKAAEGYFEKRSLKRTAGFWGLWGIGIAAVISGDFSGWNSGIGTSGWGALFIATILIAIMYFALIFSIGEMSAALPHTGGAYSFARSAMGPWGGFVTGLAETVEYVVTTAVVVWFSAIYADSAVSGVLGVDSVMPQWAWWAILYVAFITLNSLGASIGFRFALVVAVISIAVILFFVVSALASGAVDFSKLLDIAPEGGEPGQFLPFGAIGILFALPFAIWFFLGIEELPLAAEEAKNPQKDIPKAGIWGIVTLTVLGLLVLVLNPAVTGSLAISSGDDGGEPLLAGFRAVLGTQLASLLAFFALIGLLASLQGIMFAYGRNMYSLSRAGYYPKFLSLTSARFKTPVVALVVGGIVGFIILLLVLVVLPLVSEDAAGAASGIILLVAVFGAVISYVMQMVSYIVLKKKFATATRPYKSPVGIPGAVVAGVIAITAFLGIVLNETFRPAVVTFLVIYVVGLALFALIGRHRLVLSPEEEYALSGGLHGDPQAEGYDAMEEEVFGTKAPKKTSPKKE